MKRSKKVAAFAAICSSVVFVVGWQAHAEINRVMFPGNFDQLVHYATVRRGNVTEDILTTPEAIQAIKKVQPIPSGTYFVLVDYRDAKLFRYFVMEKGVAWGADYDERRRTGDWQFQWFWPDKTINANENTSRCQSCHQGQVNSDFLYTSYRIPAFMLIPGQAAHRFRDDVAPLFRSITAQYSD